MKQWEAREMERFRGVVRESKGCPCSDVEVAVSLESQWIMRMNKLVRSEGKKVTNGQAGVEA